MSHVRLALRPGDSCELGAERFGGWRADRYVEVSEGCLALPGEQLRALLAHECAHHLLGHLALRSFLFWLGRLSFAGDGFVFALLDSFGYEKEADRAVRRLGGSPEHLAEFLRSRKEDSLVPRPLTSRSWIETWQDAFALFREQYCGDDLKHYYWHPGALERIESLNGRDGSLTADR